MHKGPSCGLLPLPAGGAVARAPGLSLPAAVPGGVLAAAKGITPSCLPARDGNAVPSLARPPRSRVSVTHAPTLPGEAGPAHETPEPTVGACGVRRQQSDGDAAGRSGCGERG